MSIALYNFNVPGSIDFLRMNIEDCSMVEDLINVKDYSIRMSIEDTDPRHSTLTFGILLGTKFLSFSQASLQQQGSQVHLPGSERDRDAPREAKVQSYVEAKFQVRRGGKRGRRQGKEDSITGRQTCSKCVDNRGENK